MFKGDSVFFDSVHHYWDSIFFRPKLPYRVTDFLAFLVFLDYITYIRYLTERNRGYQILDKILMIKYR